MDDGYKHDYGVILATESFSLYEVENLKKALESKFNLIVSIQNRKISKGSIGHRLRISSKSYDNLLSLVRSHFIPSMNYKLNL
jgi:hypothetical protein